jgi:hypothetical protein
MGMTVGIDTRDGRTSGFSRPRLASLAAAADPGRSLDEDRRGGGIKHSRATTIDERNGAA